MCTKFYHNRSGYVDFIFKKRFGVFFPFTVLFYSSNSALSQLLSFLSILLFRVLFYVCKQLLYTVYTCADILLAQEI